MDIINENLKVSLDCCVSDDCIKCHYFLQPIFKCRTDLVKDALEQIEELEKRVADLDAKVPKWVSVKDELPACVPGEYLVVSSNGEVFVADWRHERWGNEYSFGVGCEILHDVTHWMEVPDLP